MAAFAVVEDSRMIARESVELNVFETAYSLKFPERAPGHLDEFKHMLPPGPDAPGTAILVEPQGRQEWVLVVTGLVPAGSPEGELAVVALPRSDTFLVVARGGEAYGVYVDRPGQYLPLTKGVTGICPMRSRECVLFTTTAGVECWARTGKRWSVPFKGIPDIRIVDATQADVVVYGHDTTRANAPVWYAIGISDGRSKPINPLPDIKTDALPFLDKRNALN
jgi:hypothetical protein